LFAVVVEEDEVGGACSPNRRGEELVRKSEGKSPLGRPRRGWVDNIEIDLLEIGRAGLGWLMIGTGGKLS
jgi:hypothetical protein